MNNLDILYPSTWRTRTQSSTWTFHNYSAALPSLPDRQWSHHRCTSMQQSHCTKTMPPLWLPSPFQQEREELLPADPRFFMWVDQYFPVPLRKDELTSFINNSYLCQDIFLDMDPYTNNELTHLGSVCTCFTDVAYWQFAHVFQRRPRDKSQLQIPNRGQRQYRSFTGHGPILLHEQLKRDHGPSKDDSFPCRASGKLSHQNLRFQNSL